MLPLDPFGRTELPAAIDRESRVRLLGEVFAALLAGEPPPRGAALFVGGAGMAWLENGGDLLGEYLQVVGPERSRLTAPRLWQRQQLSRAGCARTATDQPETDSIRSVKGETR